MAGHFGAVAELNDARVGVNVVDPGLLDNLLQGLFGGGCSGSVTRRGARLTWLGNYYLGSLPGSLGWFGHFVIFNLLKGTP